MTKTKSRMSAGGEALRDWIFTQPVSTRVSAVRLDTWFDKQGVPGPSRAGIIRHAVNRGWLAVVPGHLDRFPNGHPRKGAWVFVYRVTGAKE